LPLAGPAGMLEASPMTPRPAPLPTRPAGPIWLGTALIAITAVSFGLITTASRFAYAAGSNPETLLLLRFSCFSLAMLPVQRWRGVSLAMPAGGLMPSLGLAFFLAAMSAFYLSSVAFIPVSLAAVLLYTFPFIVALLSLALGRERMTLAKAAIMAAAFAGVTLAVGIDRAIFDARGIALALLAALACAGAIVAGNGWMRRFDPLQLTFYAGLWPVPFIAGYLLVSGRFHLAASPIGIAGMVAATLLFALANACWMLGMRILPPIRTSLIMNLEAPTTIAAGALLLGEPLGWRQLSGAAIVLGAVVALGLLADGAKRGTEPAA
jgi:drug/metabolite transporter (DMT)-like permease